MEFKVTRDDGHAADDQYEPADLDDGSFIIEFIHKQMTYRAAYKLHQTIQDFSDDLVREPWCIPPERQKIMVGGERGVLKPPFQNPDRRLSDLKTKTVRVYGTSDSEMAQFRSMEELTAKRHASQAAARRVAHTVRRSRDAPEIWGFLTLKALDGLPHPEKSLAMLQRLKQDSGIRRVMSKHKFTVGCLTEMEPLSNTQVTHEGTTRLLGLNRNRGEVIELRLRTDAGDGYRDYKTVRRTLCHELAHNVHGPHDRQFWDLCHQIEKEVEEGDWLTRGQTISNVPTYQPSPEDDSPDHGGWTGGEFVLGGSTPESPGLNRRDILRKAAEERLRRLNEDRRGGPS